jgi:hypothetical protein
MPRRLEPWELDLINNVGDKAVRDLVNDFRSFDPHRPQDPSAKVSVQGAGVVKTGDVGPQHRPIDTNATNSGGWQEAPKVDAWRPPGVDICDQLVDQQDAIDRAERIRQLAQASAIRRAEAELIKQRSEEETSKKGKGSK